MKRKEGKPARRIGQRTLDEVRTRSLVIVDREGKERARLTTDRKLPGRSGRSVTLSLLDEQGREQARLCVGGAGHSTHIGARGVLIRYEGEQLLTCCYGTHERAEQAKAYFAGWRRPEDEEIKVDDHSDSVN